MFWQKKKKPKKTQREQIIEQATQAASSKRTEIGEDTLGEIRNALMKRENSALEQAKNKIKNMDEDKLRDNLKYMLQEKE